MVLTPPSLDGMLVERGDELNASRNVYEQFRWKRTLGPDCRPLCPMRPNDVYRLLMRLGRLES